MTGIELLESLRRTDPYLPVAVVTAHATVDVANGALRNRADDFQEKPVRPAKLVAMVTELIAKGRAATLARRQAVCPIAVAQATRPCKALFPEVHMTRRDIAARPIRVLVTGAAAQPPSRCRSPCERTLGYPHRRGAAGTREGGLGRLSGWPGHPRSRA